MRGAYCIVALLCEPKKMRVGALGEVDFPGGTYVYVGSARGGIERRIERHKSDRKKLRWHIDYFLSEAEILATVAVPCDDRTMECAIASSLFACEGAQLVAKGFGSSDCGCPSHLIYLGDAEPEAALETLMLRLCMLPRVYLRERESLGAAR